MSNDAVEIFMIRSKKSGRFLKFTELCDDGFGIYEDSVSMEDIQDGEMPIAFSNYTYGWNGNSSERVYTGDIVDIKKMLICDVPKHESSDLEMVKVTMTFE